MYLFVFVALYLLVSFPLCVARGRTFATRSTASTSGCTTLEERISWLFVYEKYWPKVHKRKNSTVAAAIMKMEQWHCLEVATFAGAIKSATRPKKNFRQDTGEWRAETILLREKAAAGTAISSHRFNLSTSLGI